MQINHGNGEWLLCRYWVSICLFSCKTPCSEFVFQITLVLQNERLKGFLWAQFTGAGSNHLRVKDWVHVLTGYICAIFEASSAIWKFASYQQMPQTITNIPSFPGRCCQLWSLGIFFREMWPFCRAEAQSQKGQFTFKTMLKNMTPKLLALTKVSSVLVNICDVLTWAWEFALLGKK